jgi:hypothetical protein
MQHLLSLTNLKARTEHTLYKTSVTKEIRHQVIAWDVQVDSLICSYMSSQRTLIISISHHSRLYDMIPAHHS